MSLGLEQGINRLALYSSNWPSQFALESQRIQGVCEGLLLGIEHVGSTSVPNMMAKPIIDILVGVEQLDNADNMVSGMESLGYDYPGNIGIPNHRIFGRDPGLRRYLVHVVEHHSVQWHQYIDFRDALRRDFALAEEYEMLKRKIVEQHPQGRAAYTELKSDFINRVLERSG